MRRISSKNIRKVYTFDTFFARISFSNALLLRNDLQSL